MQEMRELCNEVAQDVKKRYGHDLGPWHEHQVNYCCRRWYADCQNGNCGYTVTVYEECEECGDEEVTTICMTGLVCDPNRDPLPY